MRANSMEELEAKAGKMLCHRSFKLGMDRWDWPNCQASRCMAFRSRKISAHNPKTKKTETCYEGWCGLVGLPVEEGANPPTNFNEDASYF